MGASGLISKERPIVITEGKRKVYSLWSCYFCCSHFLILLLLHVGHGGKLGEGNNDERVRQELHSLGYNRSLTVPEVCGWVSTCRNTIWWPDEKTEANAMAIISKDLQKHTSPLPMFVFAESDL